MTKPRSHYVDPHHARYYHVTSRCVRRAFLLGKDSHSRKDYSDRKSIFLSRLKHLAQYFSVQVMGYALMDNHFHLVLHYDPREGKNWTDEEVAFRWCSAFQRRGICDEFDVFDNPEDFDIDQAIRYHDLLSDPERIIRCRAALSSLSRFMQHLKQPFAVWANKQDTCKGHFFESRFYSGVLLDESDLMGCMAYVDLNPVEAGIAKSLRSAKDTSIHERLYADRFSGERLESYLAPLWESDEGTTETSTHVLCRLTDYVKQLNLAIVYINSNGAKLSDQLEDWMARLLNRERNARQDPCYFDYAQ